MATIKYKDENGTLVTVGAGLHTHSPSSIGAATANHEHDGRYYTKNEVDATFADLVGESPVSEQISQHMNIMASTTVAGHMSDTDKRNLNSVIAQLGGYTIKYSTTVPTTNNTSVITLVPRGQ